MLGEFTICGFRVFWQRAIMDTDWGILYYALFVLREFSLCIFHVLM